MPASKDTVVMGIEPQLDWKQAQASVRNWEKNWKKSQKAQEKAVKHFMTAAGKDAGKFYKKWDIEHKQAVGNLGKLTRQQDKLSDAILLSRQAVRSYNKEIKTEEAKGSAADQVLIAKLQKKAKRYEDLVKTSKGALAKTGSLKEGVSEKVRARAPKPVATNALDTVEKAEKLGQALISPLTSLKAKDFPGMMDALNKGGLKAGKWIGDVLVKKAAQMKKGGAAQKAGGAGIEKMVGMFSKLAPVLGIIGSLSAAFVKLLIDAEATVKEINKEVLATSSTIGFLSSNFGEASGAADNLEATLKKISSAALSLDNMGWGISKETHTAVISSLTAEGVSLQSLDKQYESLNAQTSAYSKSFGSITQLAVTYSRLMGVSLQEITSLQGEMMTEMGSSVTTAQLAFHKMTKSADDSGISANKFFSMIRGVSSDLALYNSRMDDTVKLLGMLGKVMSPRNAQQFMQFAMGAMKGMDRIQRLQVTKLAGVGATKKLVERNIAGDEKALATALKQAGAEEEDIAAAIASKKEGAFDAILKGVGSRKEDKGQLGTLNEAVSHLEQQRKESKSGELGLAQAAGSMSPARQAALVGKAIKQYGGIGSIGGEMMAQNLGISHEQFEKMDTMNSAMDRQRRYLQDGLKNDDVQAKLAQAGVKLTGDTKKDLAMLADLDPEDVISTMDAASQETQKEQETALKQEAQFAHDQAKNVSTINDKIQVLIDWFMGALYKVMMDIYDAIPSIPGFGDDKAAKQRAQRVAQDDALHKAKYGPGGEKKGNVSDAIAPQVTAPQKAVAEAAALVKSLTDAKDALTAVSGVTKDPKVKADIASKLKTIQERLGGAQQNLEVAQGGLPQQAVPWKPGDLSPGASGAWKPGDLSPNGAPPVAGPGVVVGSALGSTGGAEAGSLEKMFSATWTPKLIADGTKMANEGGAALAMASDGKKQSIYTHDTHLEKLLGGGALDAAPGVTTEAPLPTVEEEDANKLLDNQVGTLDLIYKALRQRGIKIEKIGNEKAQTVLHDEVLKAAQEALVQYYLLTKVPDEELIKGLQAGMSATDIMKSALKTPTDTGKTGITIPGAPEPHVAGANAAGGLVLPAAGELLASVQPGETIIPKGGGKSGTQTVVVELRGDAGRLFDARIQDNIAHARQMSTRR